MEDKRNIIREIAINATRSSEKYFFNNHKSVYDIILEFSSEILEISFKERIWFWVNNIKKRPVCRCGKYTKFIGNWDNGSYLRNCSVKCSSTDTIRIQNNKNNAIEKYGVDSYTKTDEYKNKKKDILLKKYGVDHYSKTDEYKEKIKKTNLEKYGVEHYSKTKEFKDRTKESCIKKYGVDNAFKSDEIKNKIKSVLLEKYNVDNYSKTSEYLLKTKETNLTKYGVDNYLESDDFKSKTKIINLEKYGVDHYSKTDEYKEKINKTCLEKYGVNHYTKTDEYKEKVNKTCLEKYGTTHHTKSELSHLDTKIRNDENYIKYLGDSISLFLCDKGHNFEISSDNYYHRKESNLLCTICFPIGDQKSIKEKKLLDYIKSVYSGEIIESYRDFMEIDIYLPELKIGFEFNGLYWHSSKFKSNSYHLDKTNYFKDRGIRIIHIWEDDLDLKFDIIKSQINSLIGLNKKIFARKCTVREVNTKEYKTFLDDCHIQGSVTSQIRIGLYFEDDLVGIMGFNKTEGRKKMELGGYNLNRFCNKRGFNIVGGASKLLNFFVKNNYVKRIVSYADKDWSVGNLYETLGFYNVSDGRSDYKYIVNGCRVHKSRYKKDKLNLEDKTKTTESQEMAKRGIYRIYDCGKLKYEKIYK